MAERSILAVAYTPVSSARTLRVAVGGFLKYIQHRDQHPDSEPEVEGLLKYVAHRDRTGSRDRLFNRDGQVTDDNRRSLATYVSRSVAGMPARSSRDEGSHAAGRRRAVYRFVLSPEFARGLDLPQLARAAMVQLEADAGGLGPWLAAEHRNTAHPHIHIVLAARREIARGQYRTVILTRPRLQRMKDAIGREIERQRGLEMVHAQRPPTQRLLRTMVIADAKRHVAPRWRRLRAKPAFPYLRSRSITHLRRGLLVGTTLLRLRAVALGYHHQMERQLEDELARRDHDGWQR
jgi:hypothetical protein